MPATNPVSVVVVCYNARRTISVCLASLLEQDYQGDWELLVVDNGSTDGTIEEIKRFGDKHDRLRLLINPQRGIAISRNIGWQQARYPLVGFTDADCRVPPHWLNTLVCGMRDYSVSFVNLAAVGGANAPPLDTSNFYSALALFLNSYLGSHGSIQGRRFSVDQPARHLPTVNVLYKKSALQHVGGFDVSFYNIGEDRDLSYRLQQAGFEFYSIAAATVTHAMRSNYRSWFCNMFLYGKGRMWLMRRHPREIESLLLLPMVLTAAFALAPLFWLPVAAYLLIMFGYSLILSAKQHQLRLCLHVSALFVGTHLCYGLGEWYGLIRQRSC